MTKKVNKETHMKVSAEFLEAGIDQMSRGAAIGGTGLVALTGAAIGGPMGWGAAVLAGAGAYALSQIK